eukprot:TRINITY_DN12033_c0_g1_i1.p2 TRINITY_DN12033_c0_g1~~TRINITY_DN12033_c0_g1_i1.p2  ORF type:complete len:642 (+),score=248.16 TRINITY_DN12033_c0_g1_i1:87-1928(+)
MRAVVLLAAAAGAAELLPGRGKDGCVSGYMPDTDYFPGSIRVNADLVDGDSGGQVTVAHIPGSTVTVSFATMFNVTYFNTYKVVTVNNRRKTDNTPVPPMVLWQCGTPTPTTASPGVPSGASFFRVPLETAALPGTIALPYFEMLNLTSKIRLIDLTYVSSPCVQKMELCTPALLQHMLHSDPATFSTSTAWVDAARQTDAVFTDIWGTGASKSDKDVFFDSSVDPGPMHRAEWIKFLALFFNKEREANERFREINDDYENLKVIAQLQSSKLSAKKKVAWVNKLTWPSAAWVVSTAAYKRHFTEDAGAELLPFPAQPPAGCTHNEAADEYRCATVEGFKQLIQVADVIIDEVYAFDPSSHSMSGFLSSFGLSAADQPNYPFLRDSQVWRLDGTHSDPRDGTRGLAWFEDAVPNPHWVLSDLIRAMYGSSTTQCELRYLRRLAINNTDPTRAVGHTDCSVACDAIEQEWVLPASPCSPRVTAQATPPSLAVAQAKMQELVGATLTGLMVESVGTVTEDAQRLQSYQLTVAGTLSDFTGQRKMLFIEFFASHLGVLPNQLIGLTAVPGSISISFQVYPPGWTQGSRPPALSAAPRPAAALLGAAAAAAAGALLA